MGCDSLQGFLFGKPMPPALFLAALAHHEALHGPAGAEGFMPAPATE
jgi:sensor c-di-GMP phosphodiesterase-like protein